jgi:beta-glucosidase/6-phospho-beta-glucosidase/beta-galactosidase
VIDWLLVGSADFLGLNYYTTRLVSPLAKPNPRDPEFPLVSYNQDIDSTWKR